MCLVKLDQLTNTRKSKAQGFGEKIHHEKSHYLCENYLRVAIWGKKVNYIKKGGGLTYRRRKL